MHPPKTVSIQLPPLSDREAAHLWQALHELTVIIDAYYRSPTLTATDRPDVLAPADQHTIDLFDDELPF